MKAAVYEKRSSSPAFSLKERIKPTPGDNEVLVKIIAASANAADYRSVKMGIIPNEKILGSDIAGQVEAVGKNSRRFAVGDQVFGEICSAGFGGFAEYVAVSETLLAMKPVGVTFESAASVPLAGITALQALRKGDIKPGQKVLIYGAGGGVGTFSVQLAKHFGSEVTAVCGPGNVDLLRSLGAHHVLDYKKEDFTKSEKRYDLILAVNGCRSLSAYRHALTPKGVVVFVGGGLPQIFKSMLLGPAMSLGSRKICFLSAKPSAQDLEYLIKLVEEGKIKPVIDRSYPLSEADAAMRYLGKGHARGKVVITI